MLNFIAVCVRCGRTIVADAADPAPTCPPPICADPMTLLAGTVHLPEGSSATLPAEHPRVEVPPND